MKIKSIGFIQHFVANFGSMNKVSFAYADAKPPSLAGRSRIKEFVESLFKKEKKDLAHLQYVFCSDDFLLGINKQHLQHDYYTDIITFDLSEATATIGEVYISVDRVRENAREHKQTLRREMLRVIFHGALHLCGYRDKTNREITVMREKEEEYLCLFEKRS